MKQNALKYYIHGFRSLIDFEVDLTPGINCLVGTNGSGKSNFIDALGFLHTLLRSNASMAVSRSGGVARVFSQEHLTNKASSPLIFSIEGVSSFYNPPYRVNKREGYFRFHYFIEIRFNKHGSDLKIIKESLKLSRSFDNHEDANSASWLGNVDVKRPVYKECAAPEISISRKLASNSPRNPLSLPNRARPERTLPLFKDFIEEEDNPSDGSLFSMVSTTRFPALRGIQQTIGRGQALNIVPERARTPDDLSAPPMINNDGTGLSSTLFAIQERKEGSNRRRVYLGDNVDDDTHDGIVEFSKIVIPDLQDISVESDIHSGKYNAFLHVKSKKTLRIPFNSVSDGTIKWLALVTSVITGRGGFSIEEPENFIHPRMQSFILEFLKEYLEDNQFILISTHSETLLNSCKPDEIVIFEFDSGKTTCRRIANEDSLLKEIHDTGFGLGYYYARNAIS